MTTETCIDPLVEFLAVYDQDDLLEIRPLPVERGHAVDRGRFYACPAEVVAARPRIEAINRTRDVYYGVAPRRREGGARADVACCRCLFADFDGGVTPETAWDIVRQSGLPHPGRSVVSGGGCHLYWDLIEPISVELFEQIQPRLIRRLGSDPKPKDASRIMRLPGTINRKPQRHAARCELIETTGERVELDTILSLLPPMGDSASGGRRREDRCGPDPLGDCPRLHADQVPPLYGDHLSRASAYAAQLPAAVSGQRGHDALMSAARKLYDGFALRRSEARTILRRDYNPRCDPPWSDREIEHKLDEVERHPATHPRGWLLAPRPSLNPHRSPPTSPATRTSPADSDGAERGRVVPLASEGVHSDDLSPPPLRPCTDMGNAQRLIDRFGSQVRFCTSTGKWLLWRNNHWSADQHLTLLQLAKQTVRQIYQEAGDTQDSGQRKALASWAQTSESKTRIDHLLQLARSEPGVPITADELDADPMVLNTLGGLVDLRTGRVREAQPTDLCAKLAPVNYDPSATCPRFRRFLQQIFGDDHDTLAYLQRLVGVFLTGDISEQIFPVFYGDGANGKSVLTDLILHILGDYAGPAPESLLTVGPGREHPTELADLKGKRLVIASETEQGKHLRVGLVKRMTGDARLKARYMRQDFFEFNRTHKTLLVTNHRPDISETKNAIWRRLHLVPFKVSIPPHQQDKHLLQRLRDEEAPGVLAWAVQGCLDWQRHGLELPEAVRSATTTYRDEADPLGDFFDDRCTFSPEDKVTRPQIAETYKDWCQAVGERQMLDRKDLYQRLRDLPNVQEATFGKTGNRTRGFRGITIRLRDAAADQQ